MEEFSTRRGDETTSIITKSPTSGLGRFCALDAETSGQWGTDPLWILPALARERTRGLPRWARRRIQLQLLSRWWSLLSVEIQRRMSHACLRASGADVEGAIGETSPDLSDLPALL